MMRRGRLFRRVKGVQVVAFVIMVGAQGNFVLINYLMAHLAVAACNVNLKCVRNIQTPVKMFVIHALPIGLRHHPYLV